MRQTQQNKILEYLRSHNSITSLDAFRHIGCTRLAGQIFELKKKGYNITSEMAEVPTRDGTVMVAVYRLIE